MTFLLSLEDGFPPSQTYGNALVISIDGYRGEGDGESVVIQLTMEVRSFLRNGVDMEQDMVREGGT